MKKMEKSFFLKRKEKIIFWIRILNLISILCFIFGFCQIFLLFIPSAAYDWPEGTNNVKITKNVQLRELTVDDDVIGAGSGMYGSIFGILFPVLNPIYQQSIKLLFPILKTN